MNEGPSSQAHVPWRQSLATRLSLTSVLIVVAALVAVGVGLVWIALQAQRASVFQSQEKSGDQVALLISSYVSSAVDDLQLFEGIKSMSTLPPAEKKAALEDLLIQRQSLFSQLALLDESGVEEVRVSQFHTFLPGDLGSRAQDDAFIKAVGGQTYLSPVYVSPDSGLLSIQVAMPINAWGGQVIGVLTGEANVSRLWQEVSQIQVGQTGYAYLVDVNGRFIAYQEPAEVLQRYGEDMRRMPPVAEFMANTPEDVRQVHEYAGLTGERVIGLYVPIQGTNWAVIIELPTQEAFASVNQMQWYLIGLTLLGMLVAGGTSFTVSQRFARPIGALTVSAQRIGSGDLGAEVVEVRRQDEVGVLARAFQQMQGELKAFYSSLEQQVVERTADLQRRSNYLVASAEVGRAATSILETDQLIGQVVELIRERFNLYYVGLFSVDESGQWAVLRAGTGEAGRAMLARGHRLGIGSGSMIGWCITHAEARVVLEAGKDAVRLATAELPDTRSEAALPLRSRGRVLGALTVQSDQPAAFDETAMAALQTMADQVAVALDNARLFAESQAALEATRRAYGELSHEAWVELLRVRPSLAYRSDERAVTSAMDIWRPEMELALKEGQTVQADGTGDRAKHPLAIPIKVRGNVIGVLDTYKPGEASDWTQEEVALMETLTEQLGTALESARLYQDTQRRAAHERVLREVTARVRSSTDPETVLRSLLREVGTVLNRPTFVRLISTVGDSAEPLAQTSAAKVTGGNGGQPAGREQPGGREQPASEGGK